MRSLRVEMEERLGARKTAALESPYRDYKFPLETFIAPNGQASGVLIKKPASITEDHCA